MQPVDFELFYYNDTTLKSVAAHEHDYYEFYFFHHLIDDGKATQLADLGLNALGLVGAHVVIGEDLADAPQEIGRASCRERV